MKIKDVMTVDVLTVPTGKTLKETAQILASTGISGLIVVDDDRKVVGVISEADILFKERSPERRRGGSFAWLFFPDMLENEAKLDARTAGEAMSSPAITIGPDRPVGEAAARMLDDAVNRLPVVGEDGELLGIVTRADLVRAFTRSDGEIEMEIRKELIEPDLLAPAHRPRGRGARGRGHRRGRGRHEERCGAPARADRAGPGRRLGRVQAHLEGRGDRPLDSGNLPGRCTPSGSGRFRNGS